MTIAQTLDPITLGTGCLLWVPLAIWIVALTGWMISGEIDPLFGLAGIVLAFMMGYWGVNPPSPVVPPLLLVCATATIILFPMAQFAMNKSQLKEIDVEAVERAYEVLAMRRDNTGAKLRLAKSLYNLGYVKHAIAIADASLRNEDRKVFREEFIQLESWRNRAQSSKAPEIQPIVCVHCHLSNQGVALFCDRCGSNLLADYVRGKWLNPGLKSKVLLIWIVLVSGSVAAPALGTSLPPAAAIAAIAALVLVIALFVWIGWRRSEKAER